MRISYWSSDVCSSDLIRLVFLHPLDLMFDEPEARRRVDEGRAEDRHVMLIGELDEAVVLLAVFGEIAAHFADECARRIGLGRERVGDRADRAEIGRAAGRERGCQYV